MENENDRKRKPRFSQKEVDVLIEKVRCQSDTLFSRFSDTLTNKKKKSAWMEVQNSVNATSMVYRNVDEIKKKWDDVKRNTKKRAASVRRDRNLTGGGESCVEPLSSVEEAVVSLIGEEKIYGISEGLDCFQQQTAETTVIASVHQQPVSPVCHAEVRDRFGVKSPRPALSAPDELQCVDADMPQNKKQKFSKVTAAIPENESLVTLQKQLIEIEKERLAIERERLRIERRRLEIEENRHVSYQTPAQCNNQTQNQIPSEFELFSSAFMHNL
ncbi:uncharacterized protein LOC143057109 [Mytilus galloprovincialis]|uniref:uncharacterized protein LOC143057109 n=1 Tax=Mytilus galloprovincialis TaxID=29158 RepID=UPI003F7C4731